MTTTATLNDGTWTFTTDDKALQSELSHVALTEAAEAGHITYTLNRGQVFFLADNEELLKRILADFERESISFFTP